MITALDQSSRDPALAAQQNSSTYGDAARFAAQFSQMLTVSQAQNQNPGQQDGSTPPSLTFSANVLATQVSQTGQPTDYNAVLAAQIQSNLTAQAGANAAGQPPQTPEQAKGAQDSLVLQSLNYQASLAMNAGNIPAFMTLQTLITKQMTSMGLITAQTAPKPATTATQASPTKPPATKTTTKASAKAAAALAAAAANASQVAASNASTAGSATSQLTDSLLSNASTAGSSAAELASNASTAGSESAALASNAGLGGAATAQNPSDPQDVFDSLQAELDALLADLEGDALDSALESLASIASKYGSAEAA